MATNQVKFYAMTQEKFNSATKNSAALYFVSDGSGDPGRIYKGSELFGAAKVYQVATLEQLNAITDAVRGDIAIGYGSAKVYAKVGETWKWVDLGSDVEGVKEIVRETFGDTIEWKDVPRVDEDGHQVNDADGHPIVDKVPETIIIENLNAENLNAEKVDAGELKAETIIIKKQVVKTENVPYEKTVEELETLIADPESGYTKDEDGNYLKDGDKVADKDGNALDENGEIVTKEATDAEGQPIMEEKDTELPEFIKNTIGDNEVESDEVNGVKVTVATTEGKVSKVEVSAPEIVSAIDESQTDGVDNASADKVASEKAVKDYVDQKFAKVDDALHFRDPLTVTGTHHDAEGTEGEEGYKPAYDEAPTKEQIEAALAGIEDPKAGDFVVETTTGNEYIYVGTEGEGGHWELIGSQSELQQAIEALDSDATDTDMGVKVSAKIVDGKLDETEGIKVEVTADTELGFGAGKEDDADKVLISRAALRDFFDNNLVWLTTDEAGEDQPIENA